MKTSHKTLAPVLRIKAIGEDGAIEGYGAVFGNRDRAGDIIQPGAFAKSLEEFRASGRRIPMLWQHDTHAVIGSWSEFSEDATGLFLKGRLNLDVPRAKEARALLQAEDIDGLSIGYISEEDRYDKERNALLLIKVRVFEVSVVTIAANDLARTTAVKSARDTLRDTFGRGETPALKHIEEHLRDGGFPDALARRFVSLGKGAFRPSDSGESETEFAQAFLEALRSPHAKS